MQTNKKNFVALFDAVFKKTGQTFYEKYKKELKQSLTIMRSDKKQSNPANINDKTDMILTETNFADYVTLDDILRIIENDYFDQVEQNAMKTKMQQDATSQADNFGSEVVCCTHRQNE